MRKQRKVIAQVDTGDQRGRLSLIKLMLSRGYGDCQDSDTLLSTFRITDPPRVPAYLYMLIADNKTFHLHPLARTGMPVATLEDFMDSIAYNER